MRARGLKEVCYVTVKGGGSELVALRECFVCINKN